MSNHQLECVMAGCTMLAVAGYGLLTGDAIFVASQKKEPAGYWLTVSIQTLMGLFAIACGIFTELLRRL